MNEKDRDALIVAAVAALLALLLFLRKRGGEWGVTPESDALGDSYSTATPGESPGGPPSSSPFFGPPMTAVGPSVSTSDGPGSPPPAGPLGVPVPRAPADSPFVPVPVPASSTPTPRLFPPPRGPSDAVVARKNPSGAGSRPVSDPLSLPGPATGPSVGPAQFPFPFRGPSEAVLARRSGDVEAPFVPADVPSVGAPRGVPQLPSPTRTNVNPTAARVGQAFGNLVAAGVTPARVLAAEAAAIGGGIVGALSSPVALGAPVGSAPVFTAGEASEGASIIAVRTVASAGAMVRGVEAAAQAVTPAVGALLGGGVLVARVVRDNTPPPKPSPAPAARAPAPPPSKFAKFDR